MNNLLSFVYANHFKDHLFAISFMQNSLVITDSYLLPSPESEDSLIGNEVHQVHNLSGRVLDYMVQTNFVAFLVLWKAKEYETSKKYITQTKTYIYQMIREVSDQIELDTDTY